MEFEDKTSVLSREQLAVAQEQPKSSRSACFVVIAGSQAGRMYKLEREEMTIGRGQEAAISIQDDGVSRRHAKISRSQDGQVAIVDLSSTNGTFCNGERVDTRTLQDGDKIQIGTTTILKFSFQDSVEEEFSKQQYESVTRDALTGCFNKKYFAERLPSEHAFAKRHNKVLSLAIMDIDHFKRINDTYGHVAGDHVLREVARVIHASIRADDILARYGGEEFALIMRETPPDNAFIAAERIRRRVEAADFAFEGASIAVTISIGVATWADDLTLTIEDLVRQADEYLYRAKKGGRNRTEGAAVG